MVDILFIYCRNHCTDLYATWNIIAIKVKSNEWNSHNSYIKLPSFIWMKHKVTNFYYIDFNTNNRVPTQHSILYHIQYSYLPYELHKMENYHAKISWTSKPLLLDQGKRCPVNKEICLRALIWPIFCYIWAKSIRCPENFLSTTLTFLSPC